MHPCEFSHPSSVKNFRRYFNEINLERFDFSIGFRCSDVQKFEKLNISSINILERNLYADGNNWKHSSIPIEISKNESDRYVDLLIYRNHYSLNEMSNVFLGDHHKNFIKIIYK